MKLYDDVAAWKKSTIVARIYDCIAMLHLHDLLTDAEVRKVRDRLLKQIRKEQKESTNHEKG